MNKDELVAQLEELSDELDSQVHPGAKMTSAEHTCMSVGGALRSLSKNIETGSRPIYQTRMFPDGYWADTSKAAYDILIEDGASSENVRVVYVSPVDTYVKVGEIALDSGNRVGIFGNELWACTDKYVGCDLYAVPKGS